MMLECNSCHKTFLYAAKQTIQSIQGSPFAAATQAPQPETKTVERHCCPFCEGLELSEVSEGIESMKSVDINEVDDWLAKGYEVKGTFAKSATIIKKAKVEEPKQNGTV